MSWRCADLFTDEALLLLVPFEGWMTVEYASQEGGNVRSCSRLFVELDIYLICHDARNSQRDPLLYHACVCEEGCAAAIVNHTYTYILTSYYLFKDNPHNKYHMIVDDNSLHKANHKQQITTIIHLY